MESCMAGNDSARTLFVLTMRRAGEACRLPIWYHIGRTNLCMWAGLTLLLAGRAQPFSCVEQVLDGPLHVLAGSKVARSWRHAPRPEALVLPPPLRLRGGEDAGGAAGAAGGRRRRKRKRTRSKHKEIFQVLSELDAAREAKLGRDALPNDG